MREGINPRKEKKNDKLRPSFPPISSNDDDDHL